MPEEPEDKSWEFYTFPIDSPGSAFGCFEPIIDLWRSKRADKSCFPAWRDFELHEFEGWWGKLALGEIDEENGSVNFVLWGTQLTTWWGRDYTRKNIVLESALGSPAYDEQIDFYRAMFSGDRIGFNFGTLEAIHRPFIHIKMVDLPLSANGEKPTHIFSVAEQVEPEDINLPSLTALPIIKTTT